MGFLYIGSAQKEAAIWYFGQNAGVDFNSGTPVALTDGALNTWEGCSTISDSNGSLLFYSDGITIWNRNHLPMPNGTGLLGDPSTTQSGIIIPHPGDPDLYYVFSLDDAGEENGLRYSIVDMGLDGGLGDVTSQKNVLLRTPISERITAVLHTDGNSIWVIARAYPETEFLSYLIDNTGINTTPVVSYFPPTGSGNYHYLGYLKASPDGTTLAVAYAAGGRVELHHFDANTGVVSDFASLQGFFDTTYDPEQVYGVEFSASGQVLYVSTRNGVYQFDVSVFDSMAMRASGLLLSQEYLAPSFPFTTFPGALQMGIDGKIYCPLGGRNFLMVINDPDVLGPGCNFVENGVSLATGIGRSGLPPFITSFFHVGIEADNFCLGDATEFSISTSGAISSINWDFGDGNTSTDENPSHTYAAPGDYIVNVTVTTASETKTETREITIYDRPMANPVTNYEVCSESPTYLFDLTSKDNEVLGSQSPTDFNVAYYASQEDAENTVNPIPALYTNTNVVETVYARVNNTSNSSCYEITSFDLVVKEAPALNLVEDWTICDTDEDGLYTFDLSLKDNEILVNQDAATFGISYFETQADADAGTNAIGPNYTNTASPQEVFFRIDNTTDPECYRTGSFSLEVITGVTAYPPADYEVCDTDNDGIQTLDLLSKNAEIIGSQNPGSISVSYHASQQDADAGMNAVSTDYTNTNPYSETLYVRVETTSNPDCYDTTTLNLAVYDVPVSQGVSDWQVCDTDNDGVYSFDLSEKNMEVLGTQPASGFSVSYHLTDIDAETGQNALTGPSENSSNPQLIFYRVENTAHPGCYATGSFNVEVFDTPTAYSASPLITCDLEEIGIQSFDLSTRDAEILGQQDPGAYSVAYFSNEQDAINNLNFLPKLAYANTQPQETIYARVSHTSNDECYAISSFEIIVNPLPQPMLEKTYVICPDSPELTIDGGGFESWSWQNVAGTEIWNGQYFNVSDLGAYSLTVSQTQNGTDCEETVSFEVVSSGAPDSFTYDLNGFSDQIELVIETIGVGEFEYSIDGEIYQDNNEFVVFPGTYTVFVRDKYECRTIRQDIVAIGYLRFFTPNGDGRHEYWNIIGGDLYADATLFIYDRYGELVRQLSPDSPGWDGTYRGKPLPASDYWFRYDYDNGKTVTGHFALKR